MGNDSHEPGDAGNPADRARHLRRKAEEAARREESVSSCREQTHSLDETQRQLHELLVHQIELEMQNDELRRAQMELEEARARYLDLYDFAPVGYCTLSEDNRILEANLTAVGMLGMPRGALISQPITRFIHRDDQDAYYLHKQQLFDTGEPQALELRMIKCDGTFFWAHITANAIRDADGDSKCRVAIGDVTERKLAEESLRESDHLLRAVIDGTDDLVFLKNLDCRMLVANAATDRIMGTSVLGKTARDYYPDEKSAEEDIGNDRRIMKADRGEEVDEIVPTAAGPRTYLVRKSPWHDAQGKVIGIIGVARDITDRKAMETELRETAEALERKEKLVTDFFINISHELKTPITLIMLALEIIESYLKKPKLNRAGMLDRTVIMKQNANRLSKLVGNILDITKIDAGFMEPKFVCVDIVRLIHSLVDSMESFAQKKELKIKFVSSVKEKRMMTDSQIIERIILNLVSNAIKHTHEGGCIQIRCKDMKGNIVISVKDNGEGIADEKKPIIFDRFRQVNTSLARSSEGTGIGLSLTKALVELLHGHIRFESALGVGSEFFVELPVLQMTGQLQLIEQNCMTIERRIETEFSDINFG